ncbi:MAG: Right handed beta helix region [Acidobacteriota bacterium]|jgi:hypothetical protein|nr:Right handed beta helix region [Acidobacteriota bacterium]
MKSLRTTKSRSVRPIAFVFLAAMMVLALSSLSNRRAEANHPVLLEGNCDSPVPSTTLVSPGTCGDFDGDGRIGTAEDTDGADRIFGTLNAAIGPGTGAAAGTGANYNGTILIVGSGRYAEQVLIGFPTAPFQGGSINPGNVTIEAAPGVIANIDAVLQGDPAGGNTTRMDSTGIIINYANSTHSDRTVTLRNLGIRNWSQGVGIGGFGSVVVDNCRFENNRTAGLRSTSSVNLVITNSQFSNNGHRVAPSNVNTPNAGDGLWVESANGVRVFNSTFSNNAGAGIRNDTGSASKVKLFKVGTFLNGTDIVGPVTISADPNYSN